MKNTAYYSNQAQKQQVMFHEWQDAKVKWRNKWQNKLMMYLGGGFIIGFPVYLVVAGY